MADDLGFRLLALAVAFGDAFGFGLLGEPLLGEAFDGNARAAFAFALGFGPFFPVFEGGDALTGVSSSI